MTRQRSLFRCQSCGYSAPKWLGRCPECEEYNTFSEEQTHQGGEDRRWVFSSGQPVALTEVEAAEVAKSATGLGELDRVLGGGIVPGSMVLIGGEPGIGKSTLLLQAGTAMADLGHRVLLVSGEESVEQIGLRAKRMGSTGRDILLLSEIAVDKVEAAVDRTNPGLLIIDSIQTMYHPEISSAPGTVGQVRESAGALTRLAKSRNLPVFIVGHVTKDGSIAGPRVLEHMVDTVLYFEGDKFNSYRMVRAVKNRFGAANELAVFEMAADGLREVANPSEIFLSNRGKAVSGSVVAAVMEGTRPMLVEVEALVSPAHGAVPRRLASGVDFNRALLTLAVLERRVGVGLAREDVYLNLAGGARVTEPAIDLGLALATASAHKDTEVPRGLAVCGEVGLSGEVRYVSAVEKRVSEAAKLGFDRIIIPDQDVSEAPDGIEVERVEYLQQALEFVS